MIIPQLLSYLKKVSKPALIIMLATMNIYLVKCIYTNYSDISYYKKKLGSDSFNVQLFRNEVSDIHRYMADIFAVQDNLLSSNLNVNLLKKNTDKSYYALVYEINMADAFAEAVNLLEDFINDNLVYRINEFSFQKTSDASNVLDIKVTCQIIAYEKNS